MSLLPRCVVQLASVWAETTGTLASSFCVAVFSRQAVGGGDTGTAWSLCVVQLGRLRVETTHALTGPTAIQASIAHPPHGVQACASRRPRRCTRAR